MLDDENGFFVKEDISPNRKQIPLTTPVIGVVSDSGEVLTVIDTFYPMVALGSSVTALGKYTEIPELPDINTSITATRNYHSDFIAVQLSEFSWDSTPQIENMVEIGNTEYYRFVTLQGHSKGPQDTGQPLDGTNLGDWFITVVDGVCTLTKPSGQTQVLNIEGIENADHVDLTFDQNGGLLVVFSVGGSIKLYWFNPQQGAIVVDDFGAGVTPYVSITSWNPAIFASEVILVYSRAGGLYYRRQDDRYATEYDLNVSNAGDILHVEINRFGQLVVEYFNTQSEAIENIATDATGNWTYEKVDSIVDREEEIQTLEVRESIRRTDEAEVLDIDAREGAIETLEVEPVTFHGSDNVETMGVSSREGAIQELRVTDGIYAMSPEGETLSDPQTTYSGLTIETAPSLLTSTAEEDPINVSTTFTNFSIVIDTP